jgi:hypothetical protein
MFLLLRVVSRRAAVASREAQRVAETKLDRDDAFMTGGVAFKTVTNRQPGER